jgi:hypothetical protein
MLGGLIIIPAEHGGFVVMMDIGSDRLRPLLFAGSLGDTLEFLRARLSQQSDPTPEVRKAT